MGTRKRKPSTRATKTAERKKPVSEISLPTKRQTPRVKMSDLTFLIYGAKKIGKTSLTSCFPSALLLEFEAGAKNLEAFQVDVPDWQKAQEYQKLLLSEDHEFKNVVIDTGKIAYDRCMEWVCAKNNISHPSDLGYGKGWNALSSEFSKYHLDFTANGLGMVIVCHDRRVEKETYAGLEKTVIEPDLTGASMNFYHGIVDVVAYYQYIGNERYLTIRGDEEVTAGTRTKNHFLTPSGEPIFRIPMGNSEEEAFRNLENAFNNKQTETFKKVETRASVRTNKKKRGSK